MNDDHDDDAAILGMRGFTHGWERILSLAADAEPATLAARIETRDDARIEITPNGVVRLTETRAGGLERIVQRHDIRVVSRQCWQRRRAVQQAREDRPGSLPNTPGIV